MPHTNADVLPHERQERILEQLRKYGRVVANDLAASFGVSEDSIRRDLREMAAQGSCRRVYGGALLPTPQFPPLSERVVQGEQSRRSLAAYAASLIRSGQVVLLDAGSTNVEIAQFLKGSSVTVVTNTPAVAAVLSDDRSVELVVIGGRIDPQCGGTVGSQALQQLAGLQADVCIPGACAVDPDSGIWGMNAEETVFKQAMVSASATTIVVASDEKIGARGSYRIASLEQIDHLIVTNGLSEELFEKLSTQGATLHRVAMR